MCRLTTFALRIAWSIHQRNVKLAIASNIFVAAGTPILYIINLIFAHRIIRAQHPRLGWHKALSILARITVVSIVAVLILLIFAAVQSSFTLNANLHRIDRDIQLFGTTFYTFIAFLPIPMVLIGLVLPRRIRTEKFGKGRFRTKIAVLLTSTVLLTFRALWSTTAIWLPQKPLTAPPLSYYGKPAFYTVQLLTELIVVYLYAFVRVDRRFYTPTGQRNSYLVLPGPRSLPHIQARDINTAKSTTATVRVYTEEELFEDAETLADTLRYSSSSMQLDQSSGKWELRQHSFSDFYTPSWYGARGVYSETGYDSFVGESEVGSVKTRLPSRWSEGPWDHDYRPSDSF
jgi:hypothetical protein